MHAMMVRNVRAFAHNRAAWRVVVHGEGQGRKEHLIYDGPQTMTSTPQALMLTALATLGVTAVGDVVDQGDGSYWVAVAPSA